jgi:hypothetical protein
MPFTGYIDEWMETDRTVFYKQRHTAKRIFDRLVAEKGYTGGYGPVQRYVKQRKAAMSAKRRKRLIRTA